MHYLNNKHRMLDKNPFFIFNTSNFESKFNQEIFVNNIFYNFINASLYEKMLHDLSRTSPKKYLAEVDITKQNTFLKISNAGGVGKNLSVLTSLEVPIDHLVAGKVYRGYEWDVIFEGENDNNLGDYSLITNHRHSEASSRIFFNQKIENKQDYKGITSEGALNINIPKEFLLFFNLHINGVIESIPQLKIVVKGKNVYNKEFVDEIHLAVERYGIKESREGIYLNIHIKGI